MSTASREFANSVRLPGLIRDLAGGLKQQMFYWGLDVANPGINLLVKQGFRREPSLGLKGTSHYKLPWQDGSIELHGACAGWFPHDGGAGFLYIRPFGRCHVWRGNHPPVPGEWPSELRCGCDPVLLHAVAARFIGWWLESEAWIEAVKGSAYRQACFRHHKRLPGSRAWLKPPSDRAWLGGFRDEPGRLPRAARCSEI